jgi:hypothetical protein
LPSVPDIFIEPIILIPKIKRAEAAAAAAAIRKD